MPARALSEKSAMLGPVVVSLVLGVLVALLGVGYVRESALREVALAAETEAVAAVAETRRAANRGERSRDEAEALAGFVLDDLRDDLAALGRSDLLERAAGQVAEYFERLPAELVTESAVAGHASVLETQALARHDLGDLDGALEVMGASVALRERAGGAPLGRALNELGLLWNARGERGPAREAFRAALALAGGREGDEWENVRASGEFGLAEVERAAGNIEGALAGYAKVRALAGDDGDAPLLQVLMTAENNAGLALQSVGETGEAAAAYGRALSAERKLMALEPGVRAWEKELATTLNNLGTLLDEEGDWEAAEKALAEALRLRRGLAHWDPGNARWLADLANSKHNLAMLKLDVGETDEAVALAGAALASQRRLILIDPGQAEAAVDGLKEMSRIYRRSLVAAGRAGEAGELAGETVAFIESLRAEGAGAGGAWSDALSGLYYDLGRVREEQGAPDEAAELRRKRAELAAGDYGLAEDDEAARYRLALAYLEFGLALQTAVRPAEAAAVFRLARFVLQDQVGEGFSSRELFLDELAREEREALVAAGALVPPEMPVVAGSEWRYWDAREPPPDSWNAPGFDDSGWKSGPAPLGYGEGDEATVIDFGGDDRAKNITAWFRRVVRIGEVEEFVTVGLRRDDGAVVYLNGDEIIRDGLPPGPVTATTVARMTERHAEKIYHQHTLMADGLPLRPGENNVIAVEIHQNEGASSDLGFDMEMVADFRLPPPGVGIDVDLLGELLGEALPAGLEEALGRLID